MKARSRSSSESPSFQSPSLILSSDDSDIVKIKKVSSSIKANIGRRNLFRKIPTDVPRLRKSAILKCFGQSVASTPIITNKPYEDCFISPIAPNESERIKEPVSKRKSRSSLRNAIKAFHAEIKQENRLRSSQRNASAQVNQEISQLKIQEILKIDACTTENLQVSLFKKRTGSLETERTTRASKYTTRQTQTSDSLNASRRKSNRNDLTNEVGSLSSLKSGVENSVSVVKNYLDRANGVLNNLDQAKEVINSLDQASEGFVNVSIISISDISVLQENTPNPANESMIFSEFPIEEATVEASSVAPQIATDNSNEAVVSSVEKLLVLSHLNLETELKKIEVVEQKVKEQVTKSGRIAMQITPLRERLRSWNRSVNNRSTILPQITANKRKCKYIENNKAKRLNPEVKSPVSKTHTKELISENNEITKSGEELAVQKKGNRKKNSKRKTRMASTAHKISEYSEANTLTESLANKESHHDQHTELESQLSQLQEFSPCVVLEKVETHSSNSVQTQSRTKTKPKQDRLIPESLANETNESTLTQSSMGIPDKRDSKKVTVDLYQYVVHRKSGFYQLPDEPITAARGVGRPQRTRRPPKQFIQAAFMPELPAVRRTTKFKPKKIDVKDEVRQGCKKTNYNLRSSTIRSENVSKVLSCTPKPKESKKKETKKNGSSRTRKPLQDLTENANRINSCMDEVEQIAQKLTPKKKVGKRLEYGNGLQTTTDDIVLHEESVRNVNLVFDKSQICISDNTITGIRRISENENSQEEVTEENSNLPCLINDEIVDVKCYSKMPLFKGNDGHPITVIPMMVNKSQNSELTLGHMKILPNKKLVVEVNKYVFTMYTVLKGKGVSTISNRHFPLHKSSVIYVPLGVSYSIHNNGSSPLVLQYTMNSKEFN